MPDLASISLLECVSRTVERTLVQMPRAVIDYVHICLEAGNFNFFGLREIFVSKKVYKSINPRGL